MGKQNNSLKKRKRLKAEHYDINTLYREYRDRMFHLALGITRNVDDAQDVLQNAFLKITKNLDRFRNLSKISTWIYRITYNEGLMVLRKKRRSAHLARSITSSSKETLSELLIHWPKLPDEALLEQELRIRLDAIIRRLAIKYRMVLLLHCVEGFSVRETAGILGIRENSVKTRLHRSYMILREGIASYMRGSAYQTKGGHACTLVPGFLYEYVTGSIGSKEKQFFDKHLKDCRDCKTFLDTYSTAIMITKSLQCSDIPGELHSRVEEFLAQHASGGKQVSFREGR